MCVSISVLSADLMLRSVSYTCMSVSHALMKTYVATCKQYAIAGSYRYKNHTHTHTHLTTSAACASASSSASQCTTLRYLRGQRGVRLTTAATCGTKGEGIHLRTVPQSKHPAECPARTQIERECTQTYCSSKTLPSKSMHTLMESELASKRKLHIRCSCSMI